MHPLQPIILFPPPQHFKYTLRLPRLQGVSAEENAACAPAIQHARTKAAPQLIFDSLSEYVKRSQGVDAEKLPELSGPMTGLPCGQMGRPPPPPDQLWFLWLPSDNQQGGGGTTVLHALLLKGHSKRFFCSDGVYWSVPAQSALVP